MSFGVLTFSQDTFAGVGGTSVIINAPSFSLTSSVGSVSIVGSGQVTLPNTLELTSSAGFLSVGTVSFIDLPSFELTGSVGDSLTFSGSANFELDSVTLSRVIGNISIIGTATIAISAHIGNNETELTTTFNAPDTSGSADVTPSSLLLTGSVGTLEFVGNCNFTISSGGTLFGTSVYGTNIYGAVDLILSSLFNEPTIQSSAVIDAPSYELTTTLNTFSSVTGTADVTLDSVELVGSVGTLEFIGDANFVLATPTILTTSINTVTLIGTANITLPSYSIVPTFVGQSEIFTVNQDDYAKNRVIHIPVRQHNVKNDNQIASVSNNVNVGTRLNSIKNVIEIPKQNRTVVVPPRQHVIRKRIAA